MDIKDNLEKLCKSMGYDGLVLKVEDKIKCKCLIDKDFMHCDHPSKYCLMAFKKDCMKCEDYDHENNECEFVEEYCLDSIYKSVLGICYTCNGSGVYDDGGSPICGACGGLGYEV